MLRYTLLLQTGPMSLDNCQVALNFCEALIQENPNAIKSLFLQSDAAYLGLNNYAAIDCEYSVALAWQKFLVAYKIPAHICSNSAIRRGIFDAAFAAIYQKKANLASMFQLTSLNQLFDAIDESERFMQL